MSSNIQTVIFSNKIQKRGELRRSSAINYHQIKSRCVNLSRNYQQIQRPITVSYELSEDLRAKEIEWTEKRYGGKFVSHHSARLIQSCYRKYRLRRDYQRLKLEKRVSRKLDLPILTYNNSTFKSPTSPNSPETIFEIISTDMKKGDSFEDLVIDKAYQEWDKDLQSNHVEKNEELEIKIINTDSGVESVDNSSLSLTPSPTNCGNFSMLTSYNASAISTKPQCSPCIVKKNPHSITSAIISNTGTINDMGKLSYKLNKSIPISHSTILCDHKNKMTSSTYYEGHVPICRDLNNSFYAPPVSPKLSFGFKSCCDKSNVPLQRYNGSVKFSSYSVPGYLSNPRLVGCKFQNECDCPRSGRHYKRLYRICLNIFNKNSLKGISYLINFKFLEPQPDVIAKFLMTRRGVSRSGIGDYLGQTKEQLAMDTLKYFVRMVDMKNKEIDVALRNLLSLFQIPGESQKITCIMEEFQRVYIEQNNEYCKRVFKHIDAIMILAYAIIMLHTDLYNPNVRTNHKMTQEEFIRNLRKADDGRDIDTNLLTSIYDRMKASEMKTFPDHTDQVRKIDQHFSGDLRPRNLIQPHRRLVCYCRLFEVVDYSKKDRHGAHQRELFLFNDILVVTKAVQKRKKEGIIYQCRIVINLSKVEVYLFETTYYPCGIQLKRDKEVLITFNTKSLTDRQRFVEDLMETVEEMSEMDRLRIEEELIKLQCSAKSTVDTSSEVTLRKHNCSHNSDQFINKNDKGSRTPLKKRDILKSVQSKSISTDDHNITTDHRCHRRSSSNGHTQNYLSLNCSSGKKESREINQANVYNEKNRISSDSGLQEDLE